jgi:hypothetical protein
MKKLFVLLALVALTVSLAPAQQELSSLTYSTATFMFDDTTATYAVNQVVTDTNYKLIVFPKAVGTDKGTSSWLVAFRVSIDTAEWTNASFRFFIYKDSAGFKKLKNKQLFTVDSTESTKLTAIPFTVTFDTLGVNATGVTSAYGTYQPSQPIPLRLTNTLGNLYVRMVAMAAYKKPVHKWVRLECWTMR